jgi:extracellular elastinolytic metalloproteinase
VRTSRGVSHLEPLEQRKLFAATLISGIRAVVDASGELTITNALPASATLWNPSTTLSQPTSAPPLATALQFLRSHASDLGLDPSDVASPLVSSEYTDSLTGVTHIYLQQQFNGLPVLNANLTVNLLSDGSILSIAGGFVPHIDKFAAKNESAANTVPLLSASLAARVAGVQAALSTSVSSPRLSVTSMTTSGDRLTTLDSPALSLDPIPSRLVYVPDDDGGVQLAWDMVMRTPDGRHWYDLAVGDSSGNVVYANDWTDNATYNVIAFPAKNPDDGASFPNRSVVTDPADPLASPYGWHDTDGVAGAEYTDTRGNNVWAQEDTDANNTGGFRPDGGATLNFDYPLDLTQSPSAYQSAAISNLFYWNNLLHDIHYQYGFTENAGNFQTNNYGRGGVGNDAVQADAQDGSGTSNANFDTPPDGTPGRMQMYLFTSTKPNRDGDLDSQVMIHEYGHGVSTRLTAGPSNSNGLNATQSAGMGEGWSDWWALMLLEKPTDTQYAAYPLGTYSIGQSLTGGGFRRKPYSYDMSIDPLTVDAYGMSGSGGGVSRSIEVHNTGEIWCSALWDMSWLLINKYGYSPNIAAGYNPATGNNKGNQLALRLVMDALKLQPANPSFKQARDAILQADQVLTGGANQLQIWLAFARRGMGYSFVNNSSNGTSVTPAYDIPVFDPYVLSTSLPSSGRSMTPISSVDFTFNQAMDTSSFSIASDVVSFTGPGGTDLLPNISGFSWVNSSTLRISFAATSVFGAYSLRIGPNILAADNGNPMDQDSDGTPGEIPADLFTAAFSYVATMGPDGFGYQAAKYPFENIDLVPGASGVTSILDGADDASAGINLGANSFNFYGTSYTGASRLFVTTNGYVSLGAASSSFTNGQLTNNPSQPTIAPYWDDWITNFYTSAAGANNDQVLYRFDDTTGDNVPDRLVIEWNNVYHAVAQGSGVTFQAILQLNTGTVPGRIIFNYVDLDVGSASNNNGASQTEGIKDTGTQGLNRLVISADSTSTWVGNGKAIAIGIDVDPPAVVSESYDYNIGPSLKLAFNEDVSASLTVSDLVLQNLTDLTTVPANAMALSYDGSTQTATLTFPGFAGGVPADGNYRLTIHSADVTDPPGNPLDGDRGGYIGRDHTFDFFVLAGDANRDRIVDIRDLAILSGNWKGSGTLFSQADFNYDGVVDAKDLGILSRNWQKSLLPP